MDVLGVMITLTVNKYVTASAELTYTLQLLPQKVIVSNSLSI